MWKRQTAVLCANNAHDKWEMFKMVLVSFAPLLEFPFLHILNAYMYRRNLFQDAASFSYYVASNVGRIN
jgi:hypothetical protein